MARPAFHDAAQLRALTGEKASQLIAEAQTPATEAGYLGLATDLESRLAEGVLGWTPPDMRFWREVVAEVRRRAWAL